MFPSAAAATLATQVSLWWCNYLVRPQSNILTLNRSLRQYLVNVLLSVGSQFLMNHSNYLLSAPVHIHDIQFIYLCAHQRHPTIHYCSELNEWMNVSYVQVRQGRACLWHCVLLQFQHYELVTSALYAVFSLTG